MTRREMRRRPSRLSRRTCWLAVSAATLLVNASAAGRFNVRDYGATGRQEDDARPALQRAIDAAAAAGGGRVLVPAGAFTSGTLHLRSHVHLELAPGATLYASTDPKAYDCRADLTKAALLWGEDLEDLELSGAGMIDGQAQYDWRPDDYEQGFDHKTMMQHLRKPLLRPFPKDFPARQLFPHLVWLGRCRHVRISGLSFLHAPSWTFALYACRHATFERLHVYTSLKEAVWADGIDLDGCRDVSITHCAIETGDDCVALVSENRWGPARVCEDVTVADCRFSSASAGIKFSEGNRAGIRNVRVSHCLFNNVNRGVVFLTARGGSISNVVVSDATMYCRRFDWFWAGDGQPFRCRNYRLREIDPGAPAAEDVPPGAIRALTLRNIVAHAQGSSMFYGHPECWLADITLERVKFFVSTDPAAPYDTAEHALDFQRVNRLKLKDVDVVWEAPRLATWKSALNLQEVNGLVLDGFSAGPALPGGRQPVIALRDVSDASIRATRAGQRTDVFVAVNGAGTRDVRFQHNDLSCAKVPCQVGPEVPPGAVK